MVHPLTLHIDPGTQDALPLKPRPLRNTRGHNVSRIREQADPLHAQLVKRPAVRRAQARA